MVEISPAEVTTDQGIVGDFRGQPGSRQITVLAMEDWQTACAELGEELPWTVRRANLLVDGIALRESMDSVLRMGSVALQITAETEPCSRMEEAATGLCSALTPEWRGGVCCRVIQGGTITPELPVTLESKPQSCKRVS